MNENNWLGYEVGDEVYTFYGRFGNYHIGGPFTVKKVTATGQVALSNGERFLNRGWEVGGGSWGTKYIPAKRDLAERLATMREAQREAELNRKVRAWRDGLSTRVDDKETRDELATSMEQMAAEIRAFDI